MGGEAAATAVASLTSSHAGGIFAAARAILSRFRRGKKLARAHARQIFSGPVESGLGLRPACPCFQLGRLWIGRTRSILPSGSPDPDPPDSEGHSKRRSALGMAFAVSNAKSGLLPLRGIRVYRKRSGVGRDARQAGHTRKPIFSGLDALQGRGDYIIPPADPHA